MELLQLRYFHECAINQSIAKTAKKYFVPASSVSASIKRMESELGHPLFDRTANRILLNENGKKLKESLDIVFSELNRVITDITCPADDGEIRLLVRSLRSTITSHTIEYQKTHSQVKFNSVFSSESKNIQNFDVIIDEQSDHYQDYECFELSNHRIFLRVAATHPLCGKKLTLNQLREYPFATMGEQSHLHHKLIAACRTAGFEPKIVAQVNDISCYQNLLRSGIVIGHGRESIFHNISSDFSYLDVTDFEMTQTICVYFKKENVSGNIKNYIEFLKTKAKYS